MSNHPMSASFPLRASNLTTLSLDQCHRERSVAISCPCAQAWDCRCRFSPRNDVYIVTAQERWTTTASYAVPRIWGNLDSWIIQVSTSRMEDSRPMIWYFSFRDLNQFGFSLILNKVKKRRDMYKKCRMSSPDPIYAVAFPLFLW